jgi:hypothetical protein
VDVYGLGAVLYEALTGRPPFRAETALETLRLVTDTEPVSPRQLQPNLPRDLETIALKCLRKAPADRYATALDLADDLRRYLSGRPIAARPVPGWVRAGKWARRHPVVAALGLLSAALFLGLLGVWARFAADLRTNNEDLNRLSDALTAESEEVARKQRAVTQRQQTSDAQRQKLDANLSAAAAALWTYSELIRTDRRMRAEGDDPFRMQMLTQTLYGHAQLVALMDDCPELRRDRARAYHSMSLLSKALGQHDNEHDKTEEYARQALAIWDTVTAARRPITTKTSCRVIAAWSWRTTSGRGAGPPGSRRCTVGRSRPSNPPGRGPRGTGPWPSSTWSWPATTSGPS